MNSLFKVAAICACLGLAACTEGDDETAEAVEQSFENAAERLDQAAEAAEGATEERLEDKAEIYRETGEAAAEAIDDTDFVAPAVANSQ